MRTTGVCTVRLDEATHALLDPLVAEVARATRKLFHRMYQPAQPAEPRDALRSIMAEGRLRKRHVNGALLEARGVARSWREGLAERIARIEDRIAALEAAIEDGAKREKEGEAPRGGRRRARDAQALHKARVRLGRARPEAAGRPGRCFGGRKLRRQGRLREWRAKRDGTCVLAGEAGKTGGNEVAQWSGAGDGTGTLKVRLGRLASGRWATIGE